MNFGFVGEKIIELLGVSGEVFVVFFGTAIEPIDSGTKRDNLGPSLKTGFENGMGVVFVLGRKEIMISKNIIDHAATNKRELEFGEEVATGDDNAERSGVHFVGGEADGVGGSLF